MDKSIALLREAGVTIDQMLEIMLQIKALSSAAPDQARSILHQDPPLAYAMFQSLLTMQLVDPDIMLQVVALHAKAQSQPTSALVQGGPSHRPLPIPPPPPQMSHRPPAVQNVPLQAGRNPLAALPDDQRAMILRVLSLSPEQLAALPTAEQATIAQIRQQFGALM